MPQNAASMTLQGRDKADMENKVIINFALNFLPMTLKYYQGTMADYFKNWTWLVCSLDNNLTRVLRGRPTI